MNLYEAIFVRKSVRNYCFDTLPPQTLDKIWEHYKEMPALFSGIGVDMAILDNRKGQERMLSMFSVKAPYYMAFYSEESERYLMNVGYIMEQMVLYLCSIGLGTCFIGSNRVKKAELEKNGKRLWGSSLLVRVMVRIRDGKVKQRDCRWRIFVCSKRCRDSG